MFFKSVLKGLSGTAFLQDEIEKLESEVKDKRFMQTCLLGASVILLITSVAAPKQRKDLILWELGLGSVLGFASAFVAKAREDIELRYQSNLELSRETYKNEVKNRYIKETVKGELQRDVSIGNTIVGNLPPQAIPEYSQKYQLPLGIFADVLSFLKQKEPEPISPTTVAAKNLGVAQPEQDMIERYVNKTAGAEIRMYSEQYPDYVRIDSNWLLELIESSSNPDMGKRANHHFMLLAETQAGKSTLAGILAKGIADRSEQPAIIAVHDAKKVPGMMDLTRWLCKFTYKVDGYAKAKDWVNLCRVLCQQQMIKVGKVGGSCQGIGELILLQDELNTCYGKGNGYGNMIDKDTAKELQAEWLFQTTNMAGAKTHGIYMGQSPLAGDTGFSLPAMNNTCFIAMGKTSGYILKPKNRDNYISNISEENLKILETVCELFDKEGLRYALVRPTKGNPYVCIIPEFDVAAIMQEDKTGVDVGVADSEIADEEAVTGEFVSEPETNQSEESDTPTANPNTIHPGFTEEYSQQKVRDKRVATYYRIKLWVDNCWEKAGRYPSSEHISQAWLDETGEQLSPEALEYLMKKLGIIS